MEMDYIVFHWYCKISQNTVIIYLHVLRSSESSSEESFKEMETRATYILVRTHRVSRLMFRHVSLDIQAHIIGPSSSGSAKSIEAVTYQLFYYEAFMHPSTITNTRISTRTCWALFSFPLDLDQIPHICIALYSSLHRRCTRQ